MSREPEDVKRGDGTDWRWVGDGRNRWVSRRSMMKTTAIAGAASLAPVSGTAAAGGAPGPSASFSDPVRINPPQRYGYEPGVHVDRFGTIYATAHKTSLTNEGTQLASFFWYSTDDGRTWQDMPAPANADDELFAFEGDIAIDDAGMVYYCDTYAADNTFSRWKTTPGGPVFDLSKPIQGTVGVDDRPWLRAHGDGIVYYLGNNGVEVPTRNNTDPDDGSRIVFYRSTDGGLTFSEGYGFPDSGYCSLAESKADDKTVYVACSEGTFFSSAPEETFAIFTSHDRGETFTRQEVGTFEDGTADPFPVWSVTDRAGNPYHVWINDDTTDKKPADVRFTRRDGSDGWETLDVTPFEGTLNKPWIGAGSEGLVAITFYGSRDVQVGDATEWFPYALVTGDALERSPTWTLTQLADRPVAVDDGEPEDFFECAIGPDDKVHVTFGREVEPGTIENPTRTLNSGDDTNNLFYTQGVVTPRGTDGDTTSSRSPPDVTGNGQPPRDPDSDGRYEDVNGDGETDVVDAQALFTSRDDPAVQNNPGAFDFNRDDEFSVVDVQSLFEQVK
ncbi:hypothetical protein BRC90_06610 [Halobacteriales archaeon QS_4_69_34]|nr:MAG: hypothetical protein BRC90_06610 [Halobacteriales archaeon QS_4_69_34]